MKRALAICAAIGLFGVASFGITLSGSWSGDINLLPTLEFVETELKLSYVVDPFTITSTTVFTDAGYTTQSFGVSGMLAFVDITGSMVFDPAAVAYQSTMLKATLELFGVDLGFTFNHWGATYVPGSWEDFCLDKYGADYQTPSSAVILYTLNAGMDPFNARVRFIDCSWGALFYDLLITFDDLPLCCGIYWDFELSFLKSGFEYALFTLDRLFQAPGVGWVGVEIEYTVDSKSVSVITTPKTNGVIDFCGTLYWTSIEQFGFTISCGVDCNMISFTTFIGTIPATAITKYGFLTYDNPEGIEFELITLHFCGPGCCGPDWNVDVSIYFWDPVDPADGTLFGISRIAGDFYIPLMENFAVTSFFSHSIVTNDTELGFGWVLSF